MNASVEQRVCLKFCIANGISCSESLKMLQRAYGAAALSKTRVYEWYNTFKSGRDVVEDLPRSGRPPSTSNEFNIAKVKKIVSENRDLSLRKIAAELSVSHESTRTILNDCLLMERIAGSSIASSWPKNGSVAENNIRNDNDGTERKNTVGKQNKFESKGRKRSLHENGTVPKKCGKPLIADSTPTKVAATFDKSIHPKKDPISPTNAGDSEDVRNSTERTDGVKSNCDEQTAAGSQHAL